MRACVVGPANLPCDASHVQCAAAATTYPASCLTHTTTAGTAAMQQQHHRCRLQAVGGMLFRCEGCPLAFCEDHLPAGADVVMESQRYSQLGMRRITAACYVRCSSECLRLAEAVMGGSAAGRQPGAAAGQLPPEEEGEEEAKGVSFLKAAVALRSPGTLTAAARKSAKATKAAATRLGKSLAGKAAGTSKP